jgi:hypothetical protein
MPVGDVAFKGRIIQRVILDMHRQALDTLKYPAGRAGCHEGRRQEILIRGIGFRKAAQLVLSARQPARRLLH